MRQTNLAYDLSRFEAPVREEQKSPVMLPRRGLQMQTSPLRCLIFAGAAALICLMLLYSKVQVAELHKQIAVCTEEVSDLQGAGQRMKNELDSRMSLRNVEEYATTELGLQKASKGQITYITVDGGSSAVVHEAKQEDMLEKIRSAFADIAEYLGF